MASNTISPVPGNQQLVDKNGMPTMLFVGFLQDLWNRAGGSTAPSNSQLESVIASLAETAPDSIVGNNTGVATEALDLTPAQVAAMLPLFSNRLKGLVPASGGGASNFLNGTGAFSAVPVQVVLDYFVSSGVGTLSTAITASTFTTASNSPGFTFSPNFSGKYKVYCSIPLLATDSTSVTASGRIINTSGAATLLSESQGVLGGPTAVVPVESSVYAQSVYTLVKSNSYVFDIQAKVISGTNVKIDGASSNFYMFAERVA
jgi:hypothetical protein